MPPGVSACVRCGLAANTHPGAAPWRTGDDGAPAARFEPGLTGTPISPEPYLITARLGERLAIAAHPVVASWAEAPASARQRSQTRWRARLVLALLAAVALGSLGGVVAHRLATPAIGMALTPGAALATAAPARACPGTAIDAAAAKAVDQATLTTGLRNADARDFRPIDAVRSFEVGQTAYITVRIVSARAGTLGLALCTPGREITSAVAVPAHSQGAYAHFPLTMSAADLGRCLASITWEGSVAAALPFVTRPTRDAAAG